MKKKESKIRKVMGLMTENIGTLKRHCGWLNCGYICPKETDSITDNKYCKACHLIRDKYEK